MRSRRVIVSGRTSSFAGKIRSKRKNGKRGESQQTTDQQRKVILRAGLPVPRFKSDASKLIGALAAKDWKPDDSLREMASKFTGNSERPRRSDNHMKCGTVTRRGKPCPIRADRNRNGVWYCHVHDPNGAYQAGLKSRENDIDEPSQDHAALDREFDAALGRMF